MPETFNEISQDSLKTPEGINELNRMLRYLYDRIPGSSNLIRLDEPTEVTIASGVVTMVQTWHSIDTESDGASDNLDTINGGTIGDVLILQANNSARTVVVKDGTGNISCAGDFSMDHADDRIILSYDDSNWCELARSSNA